jgi:hypothetical protein
MAKKKKQTSKADRFRIVNLHLVGKKLDPDEVTKLVGMQPDHSGRRGELISRKRKKRFYGFWSLWSNHSSGRIETQLKEIAKKIEPVRNRLRKALKSQYVEKAYVDIGVEPSSDVAIANYYLDGELLNQFTSLGIDIEFSVWVPGVAEATIEEYLRKEAKRKAKKRK